MIAIVCMRSGRPHASLKSHLFPVIKIIANLNNGRSLSAGATKGPLVGGAGSNATISIGNVSVPFAPLGSDRLDLIPSLSGANQRSDKFRIQHSKHNQEQQRAQHECRRHSDALPPCSLSHLRWMLQKDLVLQQDFLLLGAPELARDRRHLIFLYAALVGREVEYISLSRDTSDADLKQRKEVDDQKSIYVNQAPVRAALHGRLLILDGLEKAERNVLPTLNNLLENREMSLDDGGMLVSPDFFDLHSSMNNNSGSTLEIKIHRVHPDFRVAALASLDVGDGAILDPPLRSRFQARLATAVPPGDMLVAVSAGSSGIIDSEILKDVVKMASSSPSLPNGFSLQSVQDAIRYLERNPQSVTTTAALNAHGLGKICADDVLEPLEIQTRKHMKNSDPSSNSFVETPTTQTIIQLIWAAFESGKLAVALVGPKGSLKSTVAREAAGQYGKKVELFSLYPDMTSRDLLMTRGTDDNGNTVWRPTPLTRAVQKGNWVILDGIDKLAKDTLTSLALLMEQGQVDLPDGNRIHVTEGFRCLSLAHPPDEVQWITPEVSTMFHWIQVDPYSSSELERVLSALHPNMDLTAIRKIVQLRDRLDDAIAHGAADSSAEKDSLVLSLRKIKHVCRRVEQRGADNLSSLIHSAQMTSFMPDHVRQVVESCMSECGIIEVGSKYEEHLSDALDEDLLKKCKRIPQNSLLVPNPRFEENPGHAKVMNGILDAHSVGERALLIMGYQGVGKNRVVDYLCSRLHCEREYIQLHRDTTVQSLLSSPCIEDGRIVYHDSAIVRAARNGRILVLDEVDKAPVEVVALLKGLIEDGELALPDGRILRYEQQGNKDASNSDLEIISIHPDFRLWALANPVGFPFHGNDSEMADVFSCHTVPAMDVESHARILSSYGPNVSQESICKLVQIWDELNLAHQKGVITYPFSVRESVSVVKHLNEFPADGIDVAMDNVISFDRFDEALMKQLHSIFNKFGISVWSRNTAGAKSHLEGGISTPKTRVGSPKYGKVDPDYTPHVGGNTWAGGTGGSDTAGLGGRGGPYRLDAGHPVHHISDKMKAEVSEEAQARARQMAKEALDQKLKELDLGEQDWERYNNLRDGVALQIQQLKVLLKDIRRRKEERTWLRRQVTGEFDDSRLVDAIAGEKDVFKRRGVAMTSNTMNLASEQIRVKLVVDVSASMYRFNGYDGRLQRLLEACLMIMESLRDDDRFQLEIVGHNGTSAIIPLVDSKSSLDESNQLKVLEGMYAHTQYTYAGDQTLEAIDSAVHKAKTGDLILIITDANLKRYRIEADEVSELIDKHGVHTHLIMIGSMGEEANELARKITPKGHAQVCLDSSDLPVLIKSIVANAAK